MLSTIGRIQVSVCRLAMSALLFVLPATNAAQAADHPLTGTWIAFHDPNGIVLPHFEVMHVRPSGESTVEVEAIRHGEHCDTSPSRISIDCKNPSTRAHGRLQLDEAAKTLRLIEVKAHPVRIAGWQDSDHTLSASLFWFGVEGAIWDAKHMGNRLEARQNVNVPASQIGQPGNSPVGVSVSKILYRVDSAFASELIILLHGLDASAFEGACILEAVGDDISRFSVFRRHLTVAAKVAGTVTAARNELLVGARAGNVDERLRATIRWIATASIVDQPTADVMATLAASAMDVTEYLKAAQAMKSQAALPGLESEAVRIAECRKRLKV